MFPADDFLHLLDQARRRVEDVGDVKLVEQPSVFYVDYSTGARLRVHLETEGGLQAAAKATPFSRWIPAPPSKIKQWVKGLKDE